VAMLGLSYNLPMNFWWIKMCINWKCSGLTGQSLMLNLHSDVWQTTTSEDNPAADTPVLLLCVHIIDLSRRRNFAANYSIIFLCTVYWLLMLHKYINIVHACLVVLFGNVWFKQFWTVDLTVDLQWLFPISCYFQQRTCQSFMLDDSVQIWSDGKVGTMRRSVTVERADIESLVSLTHALIHNLHGFKRPQWTATDWQHAWSVCICQS
jgi:hypothetical protein